MANNSAIAREGVNWGRAREGKNRGGGPGIAIKLVRMEEEVDQIVRWSAGEKILELWYVEQCERGVACASG